jgi:hypothetical protein
MSRSIRAAHAKIRALAFKRLLKCGGLLRDLYRQRQRIDRRTDADLIWNVFDWLTVPLTLWPVDFEGLARHMLPIISRNQTLARQLELLLRLVGPPPPAKAQEVVGAYEHDVEHGRYEKLVVRPEKYRELEARLEADSELREIWREIKSAFDLKPFRNSRGVIRRRLSQERNFRDGWAFDWRSRKQRFLAIFDALCYKWDLYGFEHDKPLLLKISVNPTPHGTMIVIPRHWSFDRRRDLKWSEIGKLHRAHGASRQGPKLSVSRIEKRAEAAAALKYDEEAGAQGLHGEARTDFILRRLGKDSRTDPSHVKRLLRMAKRQGSEDLR